MWIILSTLAAFSQTIRNGCQKKLNEQLSNITSSWIRFSFGLPFTLILCFITVYTAHIKPEIHIEFLTYSFLAGIAQLLATSLMLLLFKQRNFAVGITYTKTELIQVAIIGTILFNEDISIPGIISIITGIIGVLILSKQKSLFSVDYKVILIGLSSGTLFALCGLFTKEASQSLNIPDPFITAILTLSCMQTLQTSITYIYILKTQKEQLSKLRYHYKNAILTGFFATFASILWFTSFNLTNVTYVKAVGQLEVVFSILYAKIMFKETLSKAEKYGIIITVISILPLII